MTVIAARSFSNATLDFEISDVDMETLKQVEGGIDYGKASAFPVFGKERQVDIGAALG